MSIGGHRVFCPAVLLRRSGRRVKTNVEKNDDRLPDDTPTAKIVDKEWSRMLADPKKKLKAEGNLSKRKMNSIIRKFFKVSPESSDLADFDLWVNGEDLNPYRWAIIGGAAFKLWGYKYKTPDIDVAALHQLPEGTFPHHDGPVVNTNDNGHYDINGAKVDWMYRLEDGSGELFSDAVRWAEPVYVEGIDMFVPVATMEHAMAIKLNAGRPKDVAALYDLTRQGWHGLPEAIGLIDKLVK